MTEYISDTGVTREVELDFDAIEAYEKEHPDWSILDLVQNLQRFRLTDLDTMSRFLGFEGYRQFIDEGFNPFDMAEMVTNSKYLGFSASASTAE